MVSSESAVFENVIISVDRYIFRMKFPTGFTYRNLLGFARFPGDSTALVVISTYCRSLQQHSHDTVRMYYGL